MLWESSCPQQHPCYNFWTRCEIYTRCHRGARTEGHLTSDRAHPPSELIPPLFNTAPHPSAYRTGLWFSRGLGPHLLRVTSSQRPLSPPAHHLLQVTRRWWPRGRDRGGWRCVGVCVCVAVSRRGCGGASVWVWWCVGVAVPGCVAVRGWMWHCVGVTVGGCGGGGGGAWVCGWVRVGGSAWVWQCVYMWRCVGVRGFGWLGGGGLFDGGLRLSLEEWLLDERREVDASRAVGAHACRP